MPAERTPRGLSATGSVRNKPSSRDSFTSNSSIPDAGSRPTSPFAGFSPYGTLTPGSSRPGSPFNKQQMARNFRKSNSSNQTFTSLLAPSPPSSAELSDSNSMEVDDPSTITWECATALVENQKVQTSYEKPVYSKTGQIMSYGKMLTKTVTMTITTTIASTEILHPGEEGYQVSLDRYKQQQEQQQPSQKQPKQEEDSNKETKSFPEAFSPEATSNQERRNIFNANRASSSISEAIRNGNFYSPAPSPPTSPVLTPKQE